jgi:hypothetical protein
MDDDKQAFSNKQIQKANILDLDERWQQSRLGSTSYLQRDKRKGSMKPNADLNFAFKEDLTRQRSSESLKDGVNDIINNDLTLRISTDEVSLARNQAGDT